jgi:RNA polymerase sigma-70 factor (ECF subfamily)
MHIRQSSDNLDLPPETAPASSASAPGRAPADPDDEALMAQIARRDPAALRALHDRYSGFVYTVCHRVLRDREAAADVLLEVFWELWQRCDRYDPLRGSASTYVATLARSRALDRLRADRARTRRTDAVAAVVATDVESARAGDGSPPVEHALLAERRAQIERAVAALSADQRAAIELVYFEGLSHTEVAQRMARPLGTVKTWIRLGLIRLRDTLRNE